MKKIAVDIGEEEDSMVSRLKGSIKSWAAKQNASVDDVSAWTQSIGMKVCGDCAETRDGIKISGLLSSFKNEDREGDIVMDGAFDETVAELKRAGKLPMLKDHSADTDSQIGSFTKFAITDEGLEVEGFISRTRETEHIIKLIEDGHLNTLSMGGLFKFANGGQRDKKNRRMIEKVGLLEGSVVVVPANPKAVFSQKSITPEVDESNAGVEKSKPKRLGLRDRLIESITILQEN